MWDDNPAQLTINAMAPAEVASIILDEESHSMDVAVTERILPKPLGEVGRTRLASDLSGWSLNIMTEQEAAQKQDDEAKSLLMISLNICQ